MSHTLHHIRGIPTSLALIKYIEGDIESQGPRIPIKTYLDKGMVKILALIDSLV